MDSFCCRCGARLSPGARFCHRCGHPCRPPERTGSSAAGKSMDWEGTAEKGLALLRRYWLAAALAVVIVFGAGVLLWQNTARCAVSSCAGRAEYGRYCSAHVCLSAGCTNCRTTGSTARSTGVWIPASRLRRSRSPTSVSRSGEATRWPPEQLPTWAFIPMSSSNSRERSGTVRIPCWIPTGLMRWGRRDWLRENRRRSACPFQRIIGFANVPYPLLIATQFSELVVFID